MTIIHDESHPDYIPLSELNIPGINLFPERKRASIIDITDDDVSTTSADTSRTLSALSSCEKPRSRSFDGNDSLSSSWPIPKKKQKTDPVPRDLSMLSPSTLRLLNKDPEKYKSKREEFSSEMTKKPTSAPLPVIDESPLSQIASRLNCAAARNRQKSEDRVIPGAKKLVVPERPSSCPTLPRSRSNSEERILSPPQLCSSPNAIVQQDDSNNMATNECSFDMDESLKSIIDELSTSGEDNAIIVISENGELSEEEYAMIAQYTMGNVSDQPPEVPMEQSVDAEAAISEDDTTETEKPEVTSDRSSQALDVGIGTSDLHQDDSKAMIDPKPVRPSSPIRLGAGTEIIKTKDGLSVQRIGSTNEENRKPIDSVSVCRQKQTSNSSGNNKP